MVAMNRSMSPYAAVEPSPRTSNHRPASSGSKPVVEPLDLVGTFVVEVGVRQAWPFITFCDNGPTPPREARLYIGTSFAVNGVDSASPYDEETSICLLPLNMLLVASAEWKRGSPLTINFDDDSRLDISADPADWTTGDIWWFSPWRE